MAKVDLTHKFGPVEQQGVPNSCVAHAVTSMIEAILGVSDLSRMFVYYNARAYVGQTGVDAGCQPRNAIKGIYQFGAPDESLWPYETTRLTTKPSAAAYTSAKPLSSRIRAYQSVRSLANMKGALSQGLPVVFGFQVPDTFVSVTKNTGMLPAPTPSTRWIGAHAAVAVGFDDADGTVLCRNSFGPTWGANGHFKMPYAWFSDMVYGRVTDAWTVVPV